MKKDDKIAILIMAAGGSKRLGRAKQLLPINDSLLLDHAIDECKASKIGDVFVVLGAYQEEIQLLLENIDVCFLINQNWEEGLSTSIAFGVSELNKKNFQGVIIVLADQVYLDRNILIEIKELLIKSPSRILVSEYKKGSGPPSFFDSSLFPELMKIKGDSGAKEIIKKYKSEVVKIYFEKGYLDIDKESDVKLLDEFINT